MKSVSKHPGLQGYLKSSAGIKLSDKGLTVTSQAIAYVRFLTLLLPAFFLGVLAKRLTTAEC